MANTWIVPSELLEPMLTQAIGLFWDECEQAGGFKSVEALRAFWNKMEALNTITVINGAPHASIAMNNQMYKVALGIKAKTGKCPYREEW